MLKSLFSNKQAEKAVLISSGTIGIDIDEIAKRDPKRAEKLREKVQEQARRQERAKELWRKRAELKTKKERERKELLEKEKAEKERKNRLKGVPQVKIFSDYKADYLQSFTDSLSEKANNWIDRNREFIKNIRIEILTVTGDTNNCSYYILTIVVHYTY
ncbi:hypothetical protein GW950_00950 [Candidatus Wolfebacteria bacterium]|nr:hypothetical protein [Candidatus Wolfebacteria bacterium]